MGRVRVRVRVRVRERLALEHISPTLNVD